MRNKKILKYIGGAMLGVFTLGAIAIPVFNTKTADAATLSGTVFEDDFSTQKLSEQWIKNDFALDSSSYHSMRFKNQTDYGSAMLYVDYQIHTDCVISFDFYQSEVNAQKARDNWFGILLGYDDYSSHFTSGNAAILSYGRGQTQLMDDGDGASDKLVNESYNDHAKFGNSFNSKENVLYTVEIVLTYTGTRYSDGQNLYQVDGYYYEKSGAPSLTPKFSYKGISADGYFGFSAMSSSILDVSNLQVFEGDELVAYENFEEENGEGKKVLYNHESSVWRGINTSEEKVYTYFNGRISTSDKADGLLLGDYNLITDTLNKKTFAISFDTKISDLSENSAFGIALGLTKQAVSAREGSFIGLQGAPEDKFTFVHIENGEVVAQTNAIPKYLYAEKEATLSFVGYYDGSIAVTLGGYTATFDDAVKSGYFAVATLGEAVCEVSIDDFKVTLSDYVSSTAPNYAIDFTGTKETPEDDFVYVERYVDERVWYLGSGVAFPKVFNQNANYIQFTDSNERSFFGAKQTYSEFICRFSVTVTQNRSYSAGSYIGLSFGKANRNDRAEDSNSIMFGMTSNGMILQAYNCSLSGSDANGLIKQYESYPELDFWSSEDWKKESVTYRVMVVARGGKAYLYYANESDMSQMNVCKAVLNDVETSGYVTVSALGGATFRLNDFAVTNIAVNNKTATDNAVANEIDKEYINVDFKNSALYSVVGSSNVVSKGISLGYDSSVKINEQYTDFLAYVDVNSVVGEGIDLKIGESFVRLNADGTIYSPLTQIGGSGNFDFNVLKNGGVIMLECIGTKLFVGVVGNNQPTDLLENWVAAFELPTREVAAEISVGTVTETVLSLSSVRLHTLAPVIDIQTDNWEETDEVFSEKNPPNGMDNLQNGCFGSVGTELLPILIIGGLILSLKKREAKDE